MKELYLIALHRFDLTLFYRLKTTLKNQDYSFIIVTTKDLLALNGTDKFIKTHFDSIITIPIVSDKNYNFFYKNLKIFLLRFWYINTFVRTSKMILADKSSPLSRFFLKRHSKILLIQTLDYKYPNFIFDFKMTFYDYLRSLLYDSLPLKYYKPRFSSSHLMFIKFFDNHKPLNTLYDINSQDVKPSFCFPPLKLKPLAKKLVIFGNRFLSWQIFSNEFERSKCLNYIYQVYSYISSYYANSYQCFYIPHPMENSLEYQKLNSIFDGNLIEIKSYFSSEHFLISNLDIECCFSISSTSSRSAYNFGFNSKVFYPLLSNFIDNDFKLQTDTIFNGLPSSFFVKSEDHLFNECIRNDQSSVSNLVDYLDN